MARHNPLVSGCERETFLPSPGPGVGVKATTYYSRPTGGELMGLHVHISRSDTADTAFVRRSTDNGRTWSEPIIWPTRFDAPGGTGRRHPRGGYADPATGRYLSVWTEGILPNDKPIEGMRHWVLHYSVSEDGGRSTTVQEQIVQDGPEFDEARPLPGVTVGHNCVMIGDYGCRPLTLSDGSILLPAQSSPVGPDGDYWKPDGAFTYTDALVLRGQWKPDGRLAWRVAARVAGDPERSTRGMIEPTLGLLSDQRLVMVMRGSNTGRPALPAHKWVSFSDDAGASWSAPVPWTYTDDTPFFSPSACSQLLHHSSGALFWIGNICDHNPNGNAPRYPIVLGEVDRATGLLIRDRTYRIDDRNAGESERLTLSNFCAREDRASGDVLLHMTRFFANASPSGKPDCTADALLYRLHMA